MRPGAPVDHVLPRVLGQYGSRQLLGGAASLSVRIRPGFPPDWFSPDQYGGQPGESVYTRQRLRQCKCDTSLLLEKALLRPPATCNPSRRILNYTNIPGSPPHHHIINKYTHTWRKYTLAFFSLFTSFLHEYNVFAKNNKTTLFLIKCFMISSYNWVRASREVIAPHKKVTGL